MNSYSSPAPSADSFLFKSDQYLRGAMAAMTSTMEKHHSPQEAKWLVRTM